jgi:hypothetical protein
MQSVFPATCASEKHRSACKRGNGGAISALQQAAALSKKYLDIFLRR